MVRHTVLRRYTELPSLMYLLQRKAITMLSPEGWKDRNDAHFLNAYKKERKLASVLALCFSETSETHHHWRVFADGPSGVCIEFERDQFLAEMKQIPGISMASVRYKMILDLESVPPKTKDLPFLKRHPFRDEQEFRIIYEDANDALETKDFPLRLDAIRRIVLNPWIPIPLVESAKSILRDIDGCEDLVITRTTLMDNEQWKRLGVARMAGQNPPFFSKA